MNRIPVAAPSGGASQRGRQKLSISSNTRVAVAVLAAAAIFFGCAWRNATTRSPVAILPPVRLPARNALVLYREAAARIVDPAGVDRAGAVRWRGNLQRSMSVDAQRAILEANRPALERLREGLTMEYRQPPERDETDSSPILKLQRLFRLLRLQEQERLASGDREGAVEADLDSIQFSESLLNGAGLDTAAMALGQRRTGRDVGTAAIRELSPTQARHVAERLAAICARRTKFADILVEEKWDQLSQRDRLLSSPNWRQQVQRNGSIVGMGGRLGGIRWQSNLLTLDKRRALTDYRAYMDACIALAARDPSVIPAYGPPPSDPFNLLLPPDILNAQQAYVVAATDDSLMLVTALLAMYKGKYGSYPTELVSLRPLFATVAPNGSFPDVSQLIYRRTGSTYTLGMALRQQPVSTPVYPFSPQ